jgi:hypothetical protein
LKKLNDLLVGFDNAFPTDGQGSEQSRSYVIALESLDHNPQIELMKFWNAVNGFVSKFGKIFNRLSNPAATVRARSEENKKKESVTFSGFQKHERV